MMTIATRLLTSIGIASAAAWMFPSAAAAKIDNVVLVHGMNMDGGAWREVYERLAEKGHHVTVVQLPMTSIEDDLAATRRAIDAQIGPVVLVGHSYGGMVISQVGTDPDVEALVYVAAFQPEIGESLAALNASEPAELPSDAVHVFSDGYYVVKPEAWIDYVANDLPGAEARYTAVFQTPANASVFGYEAEAAAWRSVPAWSAIATLDRTISPVLQRWMSDRSGARVKEIEGGHLLQMSHPEEIVALIEEAAASSDRTAFPRPEDAARRPDRGAHYLPRRPGNCPEAAVTVSSAAQLKLPRSGSPRPSR